MCPGGTYLNTSIAPPYTLCTGCPSGYVCPQGGSYSLCPANSYCPDPATIIPCPPGSTSPLGSNSSEMCSCPPLWALNDDTITIVMDCSPCLPGEVCPGGHASKRSMCPSNHSNNAAPVLNSSMCQCRPGYYNSSTSGSCTICPQGSYCDGSSMQAIPCSSTVRGALSTSVQGASSLSQCTCLEGHYLLDGVCTICPVNTYCPDRENRYECDGVTEEQPSQGAISGCLCSPGHAFIKGGGGGGSCEACPIGFYCTGLSSPATRCPGATTTASTGSSNSSDCICVPGMQGTYPTCSPCMQGYYCPDPSTSTICPADHYCPQGSTEPIPCPGGRLTGPYFTVVGGLPTTGAFSPRQCRCDHNPRFFPHMCVCALHT